METKSTYVGKIADSNSENLSSKYIIESRHENHLIKSYKERKVIEIDPETNLKHDVCQKLQSVTKIEKARVLSEPEDGVNERKPLAGDLKVETVRAFSDTGESSDAGRSEGFASPILGQRKRIF